MKNNDIQRVAKFEKIIINHTDLARAISGIEGCVERTQAFHEPAGCLLLAEGGMGKTTVCNALVAKMPTENRENSKVHKTVIPAFYASIPPVTRLDLIISELLIQLHDPSPFAGPIEEKTKRFANLLRDCETKLILLDEFHDIYNKEKTKRKTCDEVVSWLKAIVNEYTVCICLVGTPFFPQKLLIEKEMARRFVFKFSLSSLLPGDQENLGELGGYLVALGNQVKSWLEIDDIPNFTSLFLSQQIYSATGGSPSFIAALFREGLLHAFRAGRNNLSIEDFSAVWDAGPMDSASLVKKNPFKMSPSMLAAHLRSAI
jgi:GTPase SAR1 family protein